MHTREITKTVFKISDFLAWQKAQLRLLAHIFNDGLFGLWGRSLTCLILS